MKPLTFFLQIFIPILALAQAPAASSSLLGVFVDSGVLRMTNGRSVNFGNVNWLNGIRVVWEPQSHDRNFMYSVDFNRLLFNASEHNYNSMGSGAGMWYSSNGYEFNYDAIIWTIEGSALSVVNFTKPKNRFQMSIHGGAGIAIPIFIRELEDGYEESSMSSSTTFNTQTNQFEHHSSITKFESTASEHFAIKTLPGLKVLAGLQMKYRIAQNMWLGLNSGMFRYVTPIITDVGTTNVQSGVQAGITLQVLISPEK